MEIILSQQTVSVTELKRNMVEVLHSVKQAPVALLNHNRPEAYLLAASYYAQLMQRLEDLEDQCLIRERAAGPFVEVTLDDL